MSAPLKAKSFSIDKTGWQNVKFGDVVFEPKESVKDPVIEGIEHVVGLEHIDSEDIHLRRSASIKEKTTFTKKFVKGDVLFGRRRAYLKKAARAEFEGICSGDITVMRASDRLLPELLPFIVNNDRFFDYAITHSAGGLSPRVKFKDLANYEFLLPVKEQQTDLAELFLAADDANAHNLILKEKLAIALESTIHNYTTGQKRHLNFVKDSNYNTSKLGSLPADWEVVALNKHSSLMTNGFVGKATPYYTVKENGIKYIQGMNVRRNEMDMKGLSYVNKEFHEKQSKTQLQTGDILTVQSGHIGETAVVPPDLGEANCHAVIITRLDKKEFNPRFVAYFMNSPKGQVKMKGITVGTTVAHINTSELNKFLVPKPKLEEQNAIVETIDEIVETMKCAITSRKMGYNLVQSIINQVF